MSYIKGLLALSLMVFVGSTLSLSTVDAKKHQGTHKEKSEKPHTEKHHAKKKHEEKK